MTAPPEDRAGARTLAGLTKKIGRLADAASEHLQEARRLKTDVVVRQFHEKTAGRQSKEQAAFSEAAIRGAVEERGAVSDGEAAAADLVKSMGRKLP